MTVTVDDLKKALGCATDTDLAGELGVTRSTVAQWRRRSGVPERWHFLLQLADIEAGTLAARRRIFGDGDGYYLHMVALALIDEKLLSWPMLTPMGRGSHIEDWVLKVAAYVINVLGENKCSTFEDYEATVRMLSQPKHQKALSDWLHR